ncbi:MAG: hypothetical protein Cons2KO_06930 [Congregibacter sp.]
MKTMFKPLGIAAAVAAASAGYTNVSNAQDLAVANNALGDLALVPYYTVNGDWITGIHIVNTSDRTQVVKFRFRRADDSLDALDFNIVMSPQDVYAGFLSDDENGTISWSANDTTCTVPATTNGRLTMPAIYRQGADSGYVEIIAMGSPTTETAPIALAAKHDTDTLTPLDCAAVRSNFFADGSSASNFGVEAPDTTWQQASSAASIEAGGENTYVAAANVLKVSYFIRDNASGVEFGDNAVHIQNFLSVPSITNQQFGWLSGDLDGFDFPDIDGSALGPDGDALLQRGRFDDLRASDILGVGFLFNEWTANPANGAALDWVVTMPGQYTMMDTPQFVLATEDALDGSDDDDITCVQGSVTDDCDYRDIPVEASINAYNREERTTVPQSGELTVSPALPGAQQRLLLEKETNVITFGGNSVLGVQDVDISADLGQPFGWLSLSVASQSGDASPDLRSCVWDYDRDTAGGDRETNAELLLLMSCPTGSITNPGVPMIGFAAWARSVAANPDASYGRIVGHSFSS